jgi:DNA polymerase III delta subunit
MIKIFYGDDRVRAKAEIIKFLGTKDYEIIEGADLAPADLPSIFLGNSLFASTRAILIRDFTTNKPAYEKLPEYLNTPHQIAILDAKIDKRSAIYKTLKGQIEFQEFTLPKNPNFNLVFDIYRTAKRDGKKAVKMLEKIQSEEDPIMFCGLLISQALKDFNQKQGTKEKRVLRELSKLDLDLKSTSLQPWLLVQSFLLRLSSL